MGATRVWLKQSGVLALGVLVAAAMVVLGVWQLDVYRAQGDAVAQRRAAEPPVALTTVAPPGVAIRDGFGRSVTFTGRYEPGLQLLVPTNGGFRVLSGLRQDDGSLLVVVRGLVPVAPAPPPPTEVVSGTGVLLPSEEAAEPGSALPAGQVPAIRLPSLAQIWPGPLVNGFVTLRPAGAAAEGLAPAPVILPEARGRLRNGAYALQWWVFAAFAIGMAVRVARDVGRLEEYGSESYA